MASKILGIFVLSVTFAQAWWTHRPTSSSLAIHPSTTLSNTAPLNTQLAFYTLNATNGRSDKLTHSFIRVSCGATLSVHHTDPGVFQDAGSAERPILLLQHGYPESSYIWRKTTAQLSKRIPLIVADRPGYGLSEACPGRYDERTTGVALLELATKIFGKNVSVILAGHDRGARAMHRVAVDIGQGAHPEVHALGTFLADIVPIVAEYASFENPNNSVAYFHWSLLPRVQDEFSLDMIMAYGGGNMADFLLKQGSGINTTAVAQFQADNAFATYRTFYDQLSVTNASIWDYYAAATVDFIEMAADQQAGRKIKMPTHIEYSQYNLVDLSGFDVRAVWQDYVEDASLLTTEGVCCGQGHFIIELAPEETVAQLNSFMDRLGVLPAI